MATPIAPASSSWCQESPSQAKPHQSAANVPSAADIRVQ